MLVISWLVPGCGLASWLSTQAQCEPDHNFSDKVAQPRVSIQRKEPSAFLSMKKQAHAGLTSFMKRLLTKVFIIYGQLLEWKCWTWRHYITIKFIEIMLMRVQSQVRRATPHVLAIFSVDNPRNGGRCMSLHNICYLQSESYRLQPIFCSDSTEIAIWSALGWEWV